MKGDKYTIVKGYKVFEGLEAIGEPMDEPNEQHLYAWLCSRGYTEEQADKIIETVDSDGLSRISLP